MSLIASYSILAVAAHPGSIGGWRMQQVPSSQRFQGKCENVQSKAHDWRCLKPILKHWLWETPQWFRHYNGNHDWCSLMGQNTWFPLFGVDRQCCVSQIYTPIRWNLRGDAFWLVGHKWFTSAPMSDAFLTLAQSKEGVSCFVVPRWRPDGRSLVAIQGIYSTLLIFSEGNKHCFALLFALQIFTATVFLMCSPVQRKKCWLQCSAPEREDRRQIERIQWGGISQRLGRHDWRAWPWCQDHCHSAKTMGSVFLCSKPLLIDELKGPIYWGFSHCIMGIPINQVFFFFFSLMFPTINQSQWMWEQLTWYFNTKPDL